MVVVSPFVAGQESRASPTDVAIDTISFLSDVTFFQNQTITRGTSLIGGAMVASGSKPRTTGFRSSMHKETKLDRQMKTGKGFKPYTDKSGRRFTKGLNTRRIGPHGELYGYRTSLKHNRGKGPIRRSPGAVRIGRALPVIGYGLVGSNLYNSNLRADDANQTVESALGLPDVYSFDAPVLGSEKLGFVTSPNFVIMSIKALYPGGLF